MGKKLLPIGIIAALLAIVGIRFIAQSLEEEPEIGAAPVRIDQPAEGSVSTRLSYNGNLRPERTTVITPLIAGEILQIHVSENEIVEQGQLLVSLDDEVVSLQAEQARANWEAADALLRKARQGARPEELESARASLAQAESELSNAQNNLERTRNLYEAGTIARAEFENAESAVQAAETELENARRSVRLMEEGSRSEDIDAVRAQAQAALRQFELAQLQTQYAQVTSPVTGRIIEIYQDPGNTAAPGNPLVAIVSDDLIQATITVPEKHYGLFQAQRDSLQVEINPIAYQNEPPFPGIVTRIAEIIDAGSRTFDVDVAVENRGGLLKPGMFVTVDFLLEEINDAILVESSAIVFRDGGTVVFLYDQDDSTVSIAAVRTGLSDGEHTAILEGLTLEDFVVVEGNSFLEEGQTVRPVE